MSESAEIVATKTVLTFFSRVKKLERKSQLLRSWKKTPGDATSETLSESTDLGWAVLLDGSGEWLFIGAEDPPPEFKIGARVKVTIEAEAK